MTLHQMDARFPQAVREFRRIAIPASCAGYEAHYEAAYRAEAMNTALAALRAGRPLEADAALNITFGDA